MWMQQWLYKTKLTVKENDGVDKENYPVQINIDATMIDFSVTQSDGADLRFTASDGETILPHWIESFDSNLETAVVHVQMDLAANETKEIYMYYGNPAATDSSDDSIFWLFDHFNSLSIVPTVGDVTIAGDSTKYEAWPSLDRDADGNLYVVYRTADTNTHLFEPTGKIVMRKSTDGGSTWGSEITVADESGVDDRNPAILIFNNNGVERILVIYNTMSASTWPDRADHAYAVYSDDHGQTWSDRISMYDGIGHTRGKPIFTSQEKIVAPLCTDHDVNWRETLVESTDGGLTWTPYYVTALNSDFNEWSIIETKNSSGEYVGNMYALFRHGSGTYLGYATSSDYGHTWTSIADSGITIDGAEPAELWRDGDSGEIFAFHSTAAGGEIWISSDEGSTWSLKAYYAGRRGYNTPTESYYPSVTKIDDNNIGIAWCSNETSSDVFFTHMPLPITNRWKWIMYSGEEPTVASSVLTLENTSGEDRRDKFRSTEFFNGYDTPVEMRSYASVYNGQQYGFSEVVAGSITFSNQISAYTRSSIWYCEKDNDNFYMSGVSHSTWLVMSMRWMDDRVDYWEDGVHKGWKYPTDGNGIPTKDMVFSIYNYYYPNYAKLDWILIKEAVKTYPTVTYIKRIRNIPSVRNLGV